jgi:hypothetical protein
MRSQASGGSSREAMVGFVEDSFPYEILFLD